MCLKNYRIFSSHSETPKCCVVSEFQYRYEAKCFFVYQKNEITYVNKFKSPVIAIDGEGISSASFIYDSQLQYLPSTISTKKENKQKKAYLS